MRKLLLFSILALHIFSIPIFAQVGKITGVVKDASTGEALIGANILLEGTSTGAATNVEGYFVILNVSPGNYNLKASMVGYTAEIYQNLRVNIDQTTEVNFNLNSNAFQTEEVVVIATTPIVQRDVSSSGANLNAEEIKNLPVLNVAGIVGLQAGVEGGTIRGGSADEVVYKVNGITMRDGRDNTSYNNLSLTSIQQIRVQSGGFTADVGDVRSGLIEVVTKEGDKQKYTFSFQGTYRPAGNKHFGESVNDPSSYFIRPFVDDAVAWTGTNNGAWDEYLRRQYPEFEGWNKFSEGTLQNNNPDDDLTPLAAQELFLWQYRKTFDIQNPDYDLDMSFGGPIPTIGSSLGDLRFLASYKQNRTMLLVPLSTPDYKDYDASLKLTSDIGVGMKLMIEGHYGSQMGTGTSTSGGTGLFRNDFALADRVNYGSYTDAVLFSDAYFTPTTVKRRSIAAKFTHVISPTTFYDLVLSNFYSDYNTQPGRPRDLTQKYLFGNSYYVDEAPFGYYQGASDVWNGSGILMGSIYSQSRDWSKSSIYDLKLDYQSQLDKYNNIKTGFLFRLSDYNTHYGLRSELYSTNNRDYEWNTKPIVLAAYVQDKLEFEAMVATVGARLEYSNPNTDWYVYSPYDRALSASGSQSRDVVLAKEKVTSQLIVMPRLGIAFPVTENSKLFLNYGHYQTLPTPNNMYLVVEDPYGQITSFANPYAVLEKTIAYEVGYEQNLFDQFLLRATGYYKDISNQSRDITYLSSDNTVNYTKTEPVEYRDIMGFEIQLNKDRGDWVTGFINYTYMTTSLGKFGWGKYYESAVDQQNYINTEGQSWFKQTRPLPQPVARINVDFFTPNEFGQWLGLWRLNIFSEWKAGGYESWSGNAGQSSRTENNLQWLDYYNTDIRLSKTFEFNPFDIQLFMQINNVFDSRRLSSTGFLNTDDRDYYLKSLHLPEDVVNFETQKYQNIPGDDRPGDFRNIGSEYTPIEAVANIINVNNPNAGLIYYDANTRQYYEFVNNSEWQKVDDNKMQNILDNKSYIDMPNYGFFTFLNPRNIYFGIKFNVAF